MTISTDAPSRRAQFAWCLYDWANSAFPTVIITFVFSAYFATSVAADQTLGTAQWSRALALSGLIIALASPVLGAIADALGSRKPWLALCSVINIIACAALWWVEPEPGYVLLGLALVLLANVAFETAQVFYNAMLPDLVSSERIGRLSGWGWGLGYIGGLCCLLIALFAFVQGNPPLFGLDKSSAEHVRVIGPLVAIWFALFALPLFLFTPDKPRAPISFLSAAQQGVSTLIGTLRRVRDYKTIAWFLLARLFYVDGMNTMFAFGGIYAAGTFGMPLSEVIQFGIALNVTAGLGAVGFAWLDDRLGAKRTIAIALVGLIALGIPLLLVETKFWFWVFALPLGIFMGPAQAASRSLMAKLAPEHLRSEMFGLFAFSGKATSFVGPFLLGTLTLATGSQRIGMATVIVLLCIGLYLLLTRVKLEPESAG